MKASLPNIRITAICHDCRKQHTYEFQSSDLELAYQLWNNKHEGHRVQFVAPKVLYDNKWKRWLREFWSECPLWAPSWYQYGHNADVKTAYGTGTAYTITLASLASSSTFVTGREGTAISNTTNLYLDYLIGGQVTVGTTPTINTQIQLRAYGSLNDTPTYPSVFDGTDSDETITNTGILNGIPILSILDVNATTSDLAYPVFPLALSNAFCNLIPKNHGLFVTHNTGVNLNSTGSNHFFYYTGIYGTVS